MTLKLFFFINFIIDIKDAEDETNVGDNEHNDPPINKTVTNVFM